MCSLRASLKYLVWSKTFEQSGIHIVSRRASLKNNNNKSSINGTHFCFFMICFKLFFSTKLLAHTYGFLIAFNCFFGSSQVFQRRSQRTHMDSWLFVQTNFSHEALRETIWIPDFEQRSNCSNFCFLCFHCLCCVAGCLSSVALKWNKWEEQDEHPLLVAPRVDVSHF